MEYTIGTSKKAEVVIRAPIAGGQLRGVLHSVNVWFIPS